MAPKLKHEVQRRVRQAIRSKTNDLNPSPFLIEEELPPIHPEKPLNNEENSRYVTTENREGRKEGRGVVMKRAREEIRQLTLKNSRLSRELRKLKKTPLQQKWNLSYSVVSSSGILKRRSQQHQLSFNTAVKLKPLFPNRINEF